MKQWHRGLVVAASAGLALSARAQLQILTNQPGTWVNGVDIPANLVAGSQGDDLGVPITIPALYGNAVLNAGTGYATSNGRLISINDSSYANLAMSAAGPFGYYPCWDDLHTGNQTGATPPSGIYTLNTGSVFVVQWNFDAFSPASSGVPSGANGYARMQVQIFPMGGSIVAQYLYRDLGTMTGQSATIGCVTQTGAQVLQYSLNTPGVISDSTVLTIAPLILTTGACCRTDGTCTELTQVSCASISGVYGGDNTLCINTTCAPAGACCVPATLSCTQLTSVACTAGGGTWAGAGVACAAANCPTPGACCMADGTCAQMLPAACVAVQGTYRGDSTQCAAQNCPQSAYSEGAIDAGDLPATAAVPPPLSGPLTLIHGNIASDTDADMYQIYICNPGAFSASTVGGTGTLVDTQLWLFNATGFGVAFDDDEEAPGTTLRSRITNRFTASLNPGLFYIAVSGYDHDAVDSGGRAIWLDEDPVLFYRSERAPDGPGAANPIAAWDSSTSVTGTYNILLTGTCFPGGPACYANCDGGTTQPCLNVLDFGCFLNRFAAGCSAC